MAEIPFKSYSLAEFNAMAEGLYERLDDDPVPFLDFVLTGKHPEHQVVIDPLRGSSVSDGTEITLKRDYDSVLGLSPTILVDSDICLFLAPRHQDTLRTNVHLRIPIICENETVDVPIHRMPNLGLAKWNERNLLRIHFPLLYSEQRRNSGLTQDEYRVFYEKGLRPAIGNLSPHDIAEYPVKYRDELFRARNDNGTFSFQTRMISSELVGELVPEIERCLLNAGVPWGGNLLVLHQIRGLKATSGHETDALSAQLALDLFLYSNAINYDLIREHEDTWWIDVGIELMANNRCLQWRTDSHFHVVKLISGLDDRVARRITSLGSSQYSRDFSSHLTSISGCRIEPGKRAEGLHEIRYLQMYTTDKALTYHPGVQHHGKALTCALAMGDEQPTPFCSGLYTLYKNSRHLESHARLEIRVPFKEATDVLLDVSALQNPEYFVSFEPEIWWGFRCYRLLAASQILVQQRLAPPPMRVRYNALLLTAAMVWLINSLHSRPEDGQAGRDLQRAILPYATSSTDENIVFIPEEEEEDDAENGGFENSAVAPAYPCNPFGVIFLHGIQVTPHPRMRVRQNVAEISQSTFEYFFKSSRAVIENRIAPVGFLSKDDVSPVVRSINRTKLTPTYVNPDGQDNSPLFSLGEKGYTLPPPDVDDGSDLESDDGQPTDLNIECDLDQALTNIWRQFLVDLIMKAPNRASATAASYCRLPVEQRQGIGAEVYTNENLSDIWTDCQVIVATGEWERAVGHLWPARGHMTSAKAQNYPSCKYYRDWKKFLSRLSDDTAKEARRAMFKKTNTLYWIPNAVSDRIWTTKNHNKFTRFPRGATGAAPQILVRRRLPVWNEGSSENN